MKLWIKYLLGIIVGVLAAIILPVTSPFVSTFISNAFEFVVRFGRFMLLPLLFFAISTGVFKLRSTKMLAKISLWTISVIVVTSLILTILGTITALSIKLAPIPIPNEKATSAVIIPIRDMFMSIFPYSGFSSLTESAFLFPVFIFAGFAGAGCVTDQTSSKPIIVLFESASRLCYSIMSFFTEFLSIGMIAVMSFWCVNAFPVFKSGIFNPLFLLLGVDFILVSFLIYPLILRFFCNDKRPFRVIYASICPILVSFFSGDENFSLVLNLRHGKESLGIRHRVNDITYPLFSIFSRSGTALVLTICFVVILRSYSKLGLTVSDVFWISATSFALSFILGAIPQGGTFVALTVMCSFYGRGFDQGYLLLKSASPILCSFACALDTVCAMYGCYIIAVKTKTIEHMDIKHYI